MRARSTSPNLLIRISEFFGAFRWAFMPLGLFALLALGVHAAADALDDEVLVAVEWWDMVMDGFLSRFALTESWVDVVGLRERSLIARSTALVWELLADLVLAIPALGYRERDENDERKLLFSARPPRLKGWAAVRALLEKPLTVMRLARPLAAAALCFSGAFAVARMVQGGVYLSWRDLLGEEVSDTVARGLAISALVLVLASLGWRAVLRNAESADVAFQDGPKTPWRRLTLGWFGSAIVVPLAIVATLNAASPLSLFR